MGAMSRFTYELARDHHVDADTTVDHLWHIVRTDDDTDPAHTCALCGRVQEMPVEHWDIGARTQLGDLVCHQCVTRHVAEAGAEAG